MKADRNTDRSRQPKEVGPSWVKPRVRRLATSAADHSSGHTSDGFVEGFS